MSDLVAAVPFLLRRALALLMAAGYVALGLGGGYLVGTHVQSMARHGVYFRRQNAIGDGQDAFIAGFVITAIVLYPAVRWLAGRLSPKTKPATVMGSARWATPQQIEALATPSPSGLLIGREDRNGGRILRETGPAHLLTLAPTRAGKGVGVVIPNLLACERSVLCIDPKGENARIAAGARRRFGPVHVLDPFGVSGEPTSCYDPLPALQPDSLDLAEDAANIAEALVHDPVGQVSEAHWNEEAKALIAGLVMHIVCTAPPEARRLATLRQMLTLPEDELLALLAAMQADRQAAHGLVARAANRHLAKADREAAGVLSSAQRHTHFLDSPRLVRAMDGADLRFADLRGQTTTVFLVLPPDRLDAYARWLRLLVVQALSELGRAATVAGSGTPSERPSVLFLLDEFAALGRLEPVERAMGLMAGLGVQLWPIVQDLHQLRALYDKRADTFLSNAGTIQVFGTNDIDTATWLSRTLGNRTARYETAGTSTGRSNSADFFKGGGSTSTGANTSSHLVARALLTPDEAMRLPPDQQILLRVGQPPARVRKLRYYADREFQAAISKPTVAV